MTKQEFEEVVIATMQYVRRTPNVGSLPNKVIIQNVKTFVPNIQGADSHPVNPWHKVEDELPPRVTGRDCAYSIQVFVTDGTNISTNKYNFRRNEWADYPSWFNEITHWRLPELPKEE